MRFYNKRGTAEQWIKEGKLARGLAEVSAKLLVERARVWSKIFAILTPDQQDKAELIRDFLQQPLRGKPGESED